MGFHANKSGAEETSEIIKIENTWNISLRILQIFRVLRNIAHISGTSTSIEYQYQVLTVFNSPGPSLLLFSTVAFPSLERTPAGHASLPAISGVPRDDVHGRWFDLSVRADNGLPHAAVPLRRFQELLPQRALRRAAAALRRWQVPHPPVYHVRLQDVASDLRGEHEGSFFV